MEFTSERKRMSVIVRRLSDNRCDHVLHSPVREAVSCCTFGYVTVCCTGGFHSCAGVSANVCVCDHAAARHSRTLYTKGADDVVLPLLVPGHSTSQTIRLVGLLQ